MIRTVTNGFTWKMRHGLDNITIHTREHSNLIQVRPHYESGCINKQFKHSFSTLTIYCTIIARGHKYLKKPPESHSYGRSDLIKVFILKMRNSKKY